MECSLLRLTIEFGNQSIATLGNSKLSTNQHQKDQGVANLVSSSRTGEEGQLKKARKTVWNIWSEGEQRIDQDGQLDKGMFGLILGVSRVAGGGR